jgi:hypothetical protein
VRSPLPLPTRVGPAEFAEFGRMVAIRCPQDFAHILQRAGGVWEPGSRRWLVTRHRIGPVIRALEWEIDPLFRQAGTSLDCWGSGAIQLLPGYNYLERSLTLIDAL